MRTRPIASPAPLSLVRYLLPSLAVLILLPLMALGVLLWGRHQQRLDDLIAADTTALATDLGRILDLQAAGLATAAQPMAADPTVVAAIEAGDAEALLAAWSVRFTALRRAGRLSHIYFHRADRTCLLRLHDPAQRDDLIDRLSLSEAARSGRTASGLELGRLGTLTLRTVEPVRREDRIVGFVELGLDIEEALRILQGRMASWNQMAILVDKARLDRASWEATQARLGREAAWDRLPRQVVIYASQGRLPEPFAAWSEDPAAAGRDAGEVAWGGRRWRLLLHPLQDDHGGFGHILALRDVTAERAALLWRLLLGSASGLLVFGLVFAFVHRLLRRADRTIAAQQARLQDERWRLGSIIEATRAGTWEWDLRSGEVQVSERWAQILGLEGCERIARAEWEERIHPDDLAQAREAARRHLTGEAPFIDHEYRLLHRDGGWRWVHCRGRLVVRAADAPMLVFGTHSDITGRKQAEAEHLRLQEQTLARELREMTHANRLVALGTLMAGLAHEFNHPAQVLRLNQQSLRRFVEAAAKASRDLPGPAVGLLTWPEVAAAAPQMLDDMEVAAAQLSELIASVQDYARPNEGLCRAIDRRMLIAVARSSLCLVRAYARRRQVALIDAVEAAAATGRPEGCGCLQQVMVNLLINAVQATPPGGRVTLATGSGAGRCWFTVADEGPGIDPGVLARLGQPFVTTRGDQGGSGLGLFICVRLVREQNGSLELTRGEPHGTLARVTYHEPPHPG